MAEYADGTLSPEGAAQTRGIVRGARVQTTCGTLTGLVLSTSETSAHVFDARTDTCSSVPFGRLVVARGSASAPATCPTCGREVSP